MENIIRVKPTDPFQDIIQSINDINVYIASSESNMYELKKAFNDHYLGTGFENHMFTLQLQLYRTSLSIASKLYQNGRNVALINVDYYREAIRTKNKDMLISFTEALHTATRENLQNFVELYKENEVVRQDPKIKVDLIKKTIKSLDVETEAKKEADKIIASKKNKSK